MIIKSRISEKCREQKRKSGIDKYTDENKIWRNKKIAVAP